MPSVRSLETFASAFLLLILGTAAPLPAQIDYRNLDDDRPVVSEDAYPVERYGFELLAPYRFEAEPGGGELHLVVPELAYGVIANGQVGVKAPLAALTDGDDTEWGLAGIRLFGLYNFNSESPIVPGVSLRADVSLPVGSLSGEGVRAALKAIATRSWGRTRAHFNASRGFGSEDDLSAGEPLPRWSASVAIDHTFFRSSFLLIAELATSEAVTDARTAVNGAVGGRWQWTPTLVLDAGITRRLRSGIGPNIALTIGISHAFGVRTLMPVGRAAIP